LPSLTLQKIQKNNSQKQAFADQFNKLEEQLSQSQVQSKVLQEKITYLEGSGTREQYAKLELQYKALQAEKAAVDERLQSFESGAPSLGQLAESKAAIDSLEKKEKELENAKNIEVEKSVQLTLSLSTFETSHQAQIQTLKEQNAALEIKVVQEHKAVMELAETLSSTLEIDRKEKTLESQKLAAATEQLAVLQKQLEQQKSISKGLEETLASTFDIDIREKEIQHLKLAVLNGELQDARDCIAAEKAVVQDLKEKIAQGQSESQSLASLEQRLSTAIDQLQLSEANAKLQSENFIQEKESLLSTFEIEKSEMVKRFDHATEQLLHLKSALQTEKDYSYQLKEKLASGSVEETAGLYQKLSVAEARIAALESEVFTVTAHYTASSLETSQR
jgi:hypothetical protein